MAENFYFWVIEAMNTDRPEERLYNHMFPGVVGLHTFCQTEEDAIASFCEDYDVDEDDIITVRKVQTITVRKIRTIGDIFHKRRIK